MSDFALAQVDNVRIAGLATCLPSHSVSNKEAGAELYGDEIEESSRQPELQKGVSLPKAKSRLSTCASKRRSVSLDVPVTTKRKSAE